MPILMPSLFLSHGAPSLVIEDSPARHYLEHLGGKLPRPSAIIVMSAHFEADTLSIGATLHPETVYDFRGFPDELYQMRYRAKGAPGLAKRMHEMFRAAGVPSVLDHQRGLDHGIWNPLMLIYPEAEIPVVPISINPSGSPQYHARIGEILAPLRKETVLIIGSGSITHNLRRFFGGQYQLDSPAEPFARNFADWIAGRVAAGDTQALLKAPDDWPDGRANHPTDDHILPFYFALGAAAHPFSGRRLHHSTNYGVLAMDIFAFGAQSIDNGYEG